MCALHKRDVRYNIEYAYVYMKRPRGVVKDKESKMPGVNTLAHACVFIPISDIENFATFNAYLCFSHMYVHAS